jgi:hypothetical protein
LTSRYDFVLWLDADAIVVNLDSDLLAEVDGDADVWFASHPQDQSRCGRA